MAKIYSGICLMIGINNENPISCSGKRMSKMNGRSCLSNPSLLICNCDNNTHIKFLVL